MSAVQNAANLAYEALVHAARECRYHGKDFAKLGMWAGEPRCDSCKQPYRVNRALDAIDAAVREELPAAEQAATWPAAAPLPRRIPGEAMERECGWMPLEPIDVMGTLRSEGSES